MFSAGTFVWVIKNNKKTLAVVPHLPSPPVFQAWMTGDGKIRYETMARPSPKISTYDCIVMIPWLITNSWPASESSQVTVQTKKFIYLNNPLTYHGEQFINRQYMSVDQVIKQQFSHLTCLIYDLSKPGQFWLKDYQHPQIPIVFSDAFVREGNLNCNRALKLRHDTHVH